MYTLPNVWRRYKEIQFLTCGNVNVKIANDDLHTKHFYKKQFK